MPLAPRLRHGNHRAFAAGLAMPARDRCENFFVWHVEALRAAVLASGVVLPSGREFTRPG